MIRYSILFLFNLLLISLSAQEINYENAKLKAVNFFSAFDKTSNKLKSVSVIRTDTFSTYYLPNKLTLKSATVQKVPAFYIFNRGDRPGFVIVSADQRVKDIIAYSNTSGFTKPNPGLQILLNQYVQEIGLTQENNLSEAYVTPDYSKLIVEGYTLRLLGEIEWAQFPNPFNSDCPTDVNASFNQKMPVGCVATAMGQIIDKYKYPRFIKGFSNKISVNGVEQTVDLPGTEFKYELMPERPTIFPNDFNLPSTSDIRSLNPEISKLLHYCGVSVGMNYSTDESTVPTNIAIDNVKNSLEKYFNYKTSSIQKLDFLFSWNPPFAIHDWESKIRIEILNNRPVYYAATEYSSNQSHAFIIDGYDNINSLFHINWGWQGYQNAFYSLSTLNPQKGQNSGGSRFDYDFHHQMLIGIEPADPDRRPPRVQFIDCTKQINTDIKIIFDEPIAFDTLINDNTNSKYFWDNIIIEGERSGIHKYPTTKCYDPSRRTITINPDEDFQFNEKITITIKEGIKDMAGNSLDGDSNGTPGGVHTFEFTTVNNTHDFSVNSISVSNKFPVLGENVVVSAEIQNVGQEVEAANQIITLYDNEVPVATHSTISALAIDDKSIETFNWTALAGIHSLKVKIFLGGDMNSANDEKYLNAFISSLGTCILNGNQDGKINMTLSSGGIRVLSFILKNFSHVVPPTSASKPNAFQVQNSVVADPPTSISIKGLKSSWITLTDGSSVSLSDGVDTPYNFSVMAPAGTTPGTYNVNMNFTSADSTVVTKLNLLIEVIPPTKGFIAYEYWFDDLYSGKILKQIDGKENLSMNVSIPTSDLGPGMHCYHVRFLDINGSWSSVESQFFQKMGLNSYESTRINTYEYWFDNDYSSKKNIPTFGRKIVIQNDDLDVTSLSYGLHSYHLRYKDDQNNWSSVVSEFFQKMPVNVNGVTRNINTCEYWFDDGYATKVSMAVSPQQTVSLSSDIDVNSLPNGLHSYHVRYKDDAGQWSSVMSEFFYKMPVNASANNYITTYRYWFDSDDAHMIKVTLPNPINPYFLIKDLNTCNLAQGDHTVHFQFSDLNRTWSSVVSEPITKGIILAPVVTPDGETTICDGTTRILTSTEAGSYLWNTGETTQSISVTKAGDYYVSVDQESGCGLTSDNTVVHVNPRPIPPTIGSITQPDCIIETGSVTLNGLPDSWTLTSSPGNAISSGTGSSTTANLVTGSYTFSVANANGCTSIASDIAVIDNQPLPAANKQLIVGVFLEGAFNAVTGFMHTTLNDHLLIPISQPYNVAPWNYFGTEHVTNIPSDVVDWVLVELRQAATAADALPGTALPGWPKAYFLKTNGSIVDLDGTSIPTIGNPSITAGNNLFVIVRHRNSIAIISSTGMQTNCDDFTYNFKDAMSKAHGNSAGYKLLSSGVYGMVSGDADSDGTISVNDFTKWATDFGKTNMYLNSDIDFDGQISVNDFTKWATNFGIENAATLRSLDLQTKDVQPPLRYKSQVPGN